MKKFFLALCAMFLIAQPTLQADSRVCVNITEDQKMLAILGTGCLFAAGYFFALVNGFDMVKDTCEYIDYKIKNISPEFKNLVKSSTLTALGIAVMCGASKAAYAINNL
jgi:hypothetical protein